MDSTNVTTPDASSNAMNFNISNAADHGESDNGDDLTPALSISSAVLHGPPEKASPYHQNPTPSPSSAFASRNPAQVPLPRPVALVGAWARGEAGRRVSGGLNSEGLSASRDFDARPPHGSLALAPQQVPGSHATTIASLVIASIVAYTLYHASMEALVDETGAAWAGARAAGTAPLAGEDGALEGPGQGEAYGLADGWGPGVSVITVSAWQSLVALAAGFVCSRARRVFPWSRRTEPRPLSAGERVSFPCCFGSLAVVQG